MEFYARLLRSVTIPLLHVNDCSKLELKLSEVEMKDLEQEGERENDRNVDVLFSVHRQENTQLARAKGKR